jgi:DeoR/GlpR family transcriptional regulator of sugar metabolism
MTPPLFLEERRRVIMEYLESIGRVSVKSLSEQLDVSEVTIHQDLRALEAEGLLERTYGGAVLRSANMPNPTELSFDVRRKKLEAEKVAIARAATALVRDGYGVALDASTTAFYMTPYLKRFDGLTIVTNSLAIAQQFLDAPRIQVILPAGRLRRDSIAIVGRPTTFPDINLNIGFFGARGLTLQTGVTDISPEEADMKRALIGHCLQTIILIDSTKWGQIAPFTYVEMGKITQIITSERAPRDLVAEFQATGVKVQIAPIQA